MADHARIVAPAVALTAFIVYMLTTIAVNIGEPRSTYALNWGHFWTGVVVLGFPSVVGMALGYALGKEANRG